MAAGYRDPATEEDAIYHKFAEGEDSWDYEYTRVLRHPHQHPELAPPAEPDLTPEEFNEFFEQFEDQPPRFWEHIAPIRERIVSRKRSHLKQAIRSALVQNNPKLKPTDVRFWADFFDVNTEGKDTSNVLVFTDLFHLINTSAPQYVDPAPETASGGGQPDEAEVHLRFKRPKDGMTYGDVVDMIQGWGAKLGVKWLNAALAAIPDHREPAGPAFKSVGRISPDGLHKYDVRYYGHRSDPIMRIEDVEENHAYDLIDGTEIDHDYQTPDPPYKEDPYTAQELRTAFINTWSQMNDRLTPSERTFFINLLNIKNATTKAIRFADLFNPNARGEYKQTARDFYEPRRFGGGGYAPETFAITQIPQPSETFDIGTQYYNNVQIHWAPFPIYPDWFQKTFGETQVPPQHPVKLPPFSCLADV